MRSGLLLALAVGALSGCLPDADLAPAGVWPPRVPANLATAIPSPARNPLTRSGVALGRRLFFEPLLSGPNTISCGTCHQSAKAFADGVALTTAGAAGTPLRRHSPALQNLAWAPAFFWDGGAPDLESQVFAPLTAPDEMAQDLRLLPDELRAVAAYPPLFEAAFPGQGISATTVARALAQFERTLVSGDARYDHWVRHEAGAALSADEQAGLSLVRARCGSCHQGEFFTDYAYHNNGLDTVYSTDHEQLAWGRGRITNQAADIGKYKTPTLRNVALTAPYMHDGRFATLEDVLDHYSSGIRSSPTLDPALQARIPLTSAEKIQILAFLRTLTDSTFAR